MSTDLRTCRNCKHWAYGQGNPDYREGDWSRPCKKIQDNLEVEIDQGGGWDSGGATLESIDTPPGFGCNLFEESQP